MNQENQATMPAHTIPAKAIITYTDDDWRLQNVLCREPGPHELLVKLVATGICHTDIANHGFIYPRVLGHEGAGHILRKGSSCSSNLSEGDPVLLSFAHCQNCNMCRRGHPAHCHSAMSLNILGQDLNYALAEGEPDDERLEKDENGRHRLVKAAYFGHSSFSSVALVNERSITSMKGLAGEEDLVAFAPLGCGVQTGACSVTNVMKAQAGDSIAVFGLGGVGLSALMAAKVLQLKTIVAVDIHDSRLQMGRELGATHTINTKGMGKDEIVAAVRGLDVFQGDDAPLGPNHIIDTTGVGILLQAALGAVDHMGTVVQLTHQGLGSTVAVNLPQHMASGVRLVGTIQGDATPSQSLPMLIDWYRQGKLPVQRLQKHYPVEDFERARQEMHKGQTIKPLLLW